MTDASEAVSSEAEEPTSVAQTFHHAACKVCNSLDRKQIEIALLLGESRPRIAKRFPNDNLNRSNLCTHKNRHMDVVDAGVAEAVRARTAALRLDPDTAGGAVVGRLNLIDQLLTAGLSAAQAGSIRYSARDLLALIDERERLANEHQTMEQLETNARAWVDAVKEVVPREMWEQVLDSWEAKVVAGQGGE